MLIAAVDRRDGLGNRVKFVLSCKAIAEAEGRVFAYYWPVDDRFGARFDDLWQTGYELTLDRRGPDPVLMYRGGRRDELGPRDAEVLSLDGQYDVPGFGNERHWGQMLAELEIAPAVRDKTDATAGLLGDDFIGVQVRAHPTLSHAKTMEHSPVSWFIRRMREFKQERPNARFFLSTDTPESAAEIQSAVPDVHTLRKSGGYNTLQGLQESVADLLLLSQSTYMLIPYASTFAHLAWEMSGRRMTLEHSMGKMLANSPRG